MNKHVDKHLHSLTKNVFFPPPNCPNNHTLILLPPIFQPLVSLTAAWAKSVLLYRMRAIPFNLSNTTYKKIHTYVLTITSTLSNKTNKHKQAFRGRIKI